ncbi:MAG: hypothetical protein NZ108_06730, partial [Bacteroidia bacterium]|nr:hypothetical protein [Bacteroidia bacterium]
MKRIFCLLLMLLCSLSGFTAPGDTIWVTPHNQTHLNWYGSFDAWGVFPSTATRYEKVKLFYTINCPNQGCSDWDY